MSFFHTTEFYIILFIVAAAVVALAALPHRSGAVREILLAADLIPAAADALVAESPAIEVNCDERGNVILMRRGLPDIYMSGAVSAKVEVKGFDITVYERLTQARDGDYSRRADTAVFTLDFLGSERYYLRYESEVTSSAATIAFRNVAGYHPRPVSLKQ